MVKSAFSNLVFDFGNVLLDIDIPGAMDRLMGLLRKDADRTRIDQVLLQYERGKVSNEIFINTVISQSGRHVQALDVIEAWNSMLIGIPASRLEMLLKLRKKYKVYLLSNTNALHIEWVRRYMARTYGHRDFEAVYFDHAYYSHEIGERKPDASIFQYLIRDTGLVPGESLFLDDHLPNIEAALALGFGTHLKREEEEITDVLRNLY